MDKIEYCAVLKFIVKEGLTPNEIHSKFAGQRFSSNQEATVSCRGVFCRSYEEPLQGRDNGAGASLE